MIYASIPLWIQILSSFLTLILSIVATTIIVFQYFLQKNRWRLDLFDKRYEIYKSTKEYLDIRSIYGTITKDQLINFSNKTIDHDFLFEDEIQSLLGDLYKMGEKLIEINRQLEVENDEEKRKVLLENEIEIKKWFGEQRARTKLLFSKYLEITKR